LRPAKIVLAMRSMLLALALVWGATAAADDVKPPEKLTFPSSRGPTIFNHAAHVKRQNGRCADCHDKLYPQSAKAPPKGSEGCRTCHKAGGPAFTTQACAKCHEAPAAAAKP
jgi:c(7)-type cytochrome triheme protein